MPELIKISPCVNCKSVPEILYDPFDSDGFVFLLKHKSNEHNICPYDLHAYHYTRRQCIKSWNDYNIPLDKRSPHVSRIGI